MSAFPYHFTHWAEFSRQGRGIVGDLKRARLRLHPPQPAARPPKTASKQCRNLFRRCFSLQALDFIVVVKQTGGSVERRKDRIFFTFPDAWPEPLPQKYTTFRRSTLRPSVSATHYVSMSSVKKQRRKGFRRCF